MWCTVGRVLLLLLAVAGTSLAHEDERHPRVPDQPLPVVFKPWACSECTKREIAGAEDRPVEVMRASPDALVRELKIRNDWIAIESPNFRVFSTLEGAKISYGDTRFAAADMQRLKEIFTDLSPGARSTYLKAHERAHLYHIRLERLCSHFRALTGNDLPFLGMGSHFEVYLFEDGKEIGAFSSKKFGREWDGELPVVRKHFGGEGNRYVVAITQDVMRGKDHELSNMVAHHTGHMLINGHRDFLTDVWAWLEAGTAHYYERRESTEYNYFCLVDVEPPAKFVRGDWRKRIRHMVYRKKDLPLGSWCEKLHAPELTGVQHALSWSIVSWLAETDPVRLTKLMDLSADTSKMKAADAIEKVYGISPYALHERWRAYVLEKYK